MRWACRAKKNFDHDSRPYWRSWLREGPTAGTKTGPCQSPFCSAQTTLLAWTIILSTGMEEFSSRSLCATFTAEMHSKLFQEIPFVYKPSRRGHERWLSSTYKRLANNRHHQRSVHTIHNPYRRAPSPDHGPNPSDMYTAEFSTACFVWILITGIFMVVRAFFARFPGS